MWEQAEGCEGGDRTGAIYHKEHNSAPVSNHLFFFLFTLLKPSLPFALVPSPPLFTISSDVLSPICFLFSPRHF